MALPSEMNAADISAAGGATAAALAIERARIDVGVGGVASVASDLALGPAASFILRAPQAALDAQAAVASIPGYTVVTAPAYLEMTLDGYGRISEGLRLDGIREIARADIDDLRPKTMTIGGQRTIAMNIPGYLEAVVSGDGNIAGGWRDDGRLEAAALTAVQSINDVPIADILAGGGGGIAKRVAQLRAQIMGSASYGQSLSNGYLSKLALSLQQLFDSLMFNVGTRTLDKGVATSLVPLVEADDGNFGETLLSSAFATVKRALIANHQINPGDYPYQLLGSAPGAAGVAIAGLSPGSSPFTQFMNDITRGCAFANALGKSYAFGVWYGTQGSSDYVENTPRATWKAAASTMTDAVRDHARSVTKQKFDPQAIWGQSTDHWMYGYTDNPHIALSQLELSKERADFHIACPLYMFPTVDGQHLTNEGQIWYGAYQGLCQYHVDILAEEWKPLDCVEAYAQSTGSFHTVRARFEGAVGNLVWDTAISARAGNRGFNVLNSAGAACTISSINIVAPDEIEIVVTSSAVGGKLANGRNNAGVCALRDQQGDTLPLVPGINRPLHNHCVLFEKAL